MRATGPLAVIGLTAFLVFGTVTVPANAAEVITTFDGVTYTADNTNVSAGATATDYNPASGPAVTIPSFVTIGGTEYFVTTIGDFAFENNALTTLTLPDTVTTIGYAAFANNFLTSVTLPNTLTTIGDSAFYGNDITSVTLPDTLITIDGGAFYDNALASVTLPNTLTTIGDGAFAFNDLTSVTLPDTLTTIGDGAFFANALSSVTLPNTVTTIGDFAFSSNGLASVTLPNTLITIGDYAFSSNDLTSVTLPNTLTTIGDYAFATNDLTSVTLPNTLTTIGGHAFLDNDLTSVRFLGAAPASFGLSVFTSDPLVSYYWRFGDSQITSGFTTPSWNGYKTQAIAIITYDTNGGTTIDPADTVVGTTATEPAAAVKTDYKFDGWYTAATGGTAWNFTTDTVAGDMTLFARYTAVPATPTGTALAATGVAIPTIPAGIGAILLLAGVALLTRRRA